MKFLIAANWKMNKTQEEASSFTKELAQVVLSLPENKDVAIFPPFTALQSSRASLPHNFLLGAQNFYPEKEGAYTGEISLCMLSDCGCSIVLVGHSERRSLLCESDELIGVKTSYAINNGFSVILCIGESLADREAGNRDSVLKKQLAVALADVKSTDNLLIAYEPVWAIGTGQVAGEQEITETHKFIRSELCNKYNKSGELVRILYGGSVNASNAKKIITLDNVNGLLVGGASLDVKSFAQIINA